MGSSKHAVLNQINGFHYQVLLGAERCYQLNEGQSIYFERDGDLSIEGYEKENNIQIEAKLYADKLTNKHENFWKTLANWLDIDYQKYQYLILHTTQPFGNETEFKDWNKKSVKEKYEIIKLEYEKLSDADKDTTNITKINSFIVKVYDFKEEKLKSILGKFYIYTESENLDEIKSTLLKKPTGIPKANQQAYLDGLIGFIYSKTNNQNWEVTYDDIQTKFEELTSKYSVQPFTFPEFKNYQADESTIKEHATSIYYKKIEAVGLDDEIPLAVGNLSEFIESLKLKLHNHLLYAEKTKSYKEVVKRKIKDKYSITALNYPNADVNARSKVFYQGMIADEPYHMDEYGFPPIAYKNGSIHDIMDDDKEDFKWKVE